MAEQGDKSYAGKEVVESYDFSHLKGDIVYKSAET